MIKREGLREGKKASRHFGKQAAKLKGLPVGKFSLGSLCWKHSKNHTSTLRPLQACLSSSLAGSLGSSGTSSKGSSFLVTEPGVFSRTPNACDHGKSLGSTVQKRCVMKAYMTSGLRTRERDFFPCFPEQSAGWF